MSLKSELCLSCRGWARHRRWRGLDPGGHHSCSAACEHCSDDGEAWTGTGPGVLRSRWGGDTRTGGSAPPPRPDRGIKINFTVERLCRKVIFVCPFIQLTLGKAIKVISVWIEKDVTEFLSVVPGQTSHAKRYCDPSGRRTNNLLMINATNVIKHCPLMALIKYRASVEQLAMAESRVPDVARGCIV